MLVLLLQWQQQALRRLQEGEAALACVFFSSTSLVLLLQWQQQPFQALCFAQALLVLRTSLVLLLFLRSKNKNKPCKGNAPSSCYCCAFFLLLLLLLRTLVTPSCASFAMATTSPARETRSLEGAFPLQDQARGPFAVRATKSPILKACLLLPLQKKHKGLCFAQACLFSLLQKKHVSLKGVTRRRLSSLRACSLHCKKSTCPLKALPEGA